MKNKIITLIVVLLILVTPSVIALSSYLSAQSNPVTKQSVTKMVLSIPDEADKVFVKGEKGSSEA